VDLSFHQIPECPKRRDPAARKRRSSAVSGARNRLPRSGAATMWARRRFHGMAWPTVTHMWVAVIATVWIGY